MSAQGILIWAQVVGIVVQIISPRRWGVLFPSGNVVNVVVNKYLFCFALQMRRSCISLEQKQKSNLKLTLIDVNCLKNAP